MTNPDIEKAVELAKHLSKIDPRCCKDCEKFVLLATSVIALHARCEKLERVLTRIEKIVPFTLDDIKKECGL